RRHPGTDRCSRRPAPAGIDPRGGRASIRRAGIPRGGEARRVRSQEPHRRRRARPAGRGGRAPGSRAGRSAGAGGGSRVPRGRGTRRSGEEQRMSDEVLYEKRGPAAWITLNRPEKLNAMNVEVVKQLGERLRTAETDDAVKVVVLTGAGRAFSAGYDISEEVG